MKNFALVALLLTTACSRTHERVVCIGFDNSGTVRRTGNPYDAGWDQVLKTSHGGDHFYAALINDKGLANGRPPIEFTLRPYSFATDKWRDYDEAIKSKIEKQRQLLDAILKNSAPSKSTAIIGFLHGASQIFRAYPANVSRELVVFSDGIEESHINLAKLDLTDQVISKIIADERQAGRLPSLSGVTVWFVVTGPLQTTRITSNKLLRLEIFWRRYLEACGATLRAYSPVLVNFGGE